MTALQLAASGETVSRETGVQVDAVMQMERANGANTSKATSLSSPLLTRVPS